MDKSKLFLTATGVIFLSLAAHAEMTSTNSLSDNTKVNVRDRNSNEPTSDQAKNNLSDRQVMQSIRKSVMADKSFSTYAQNVKIISEHGKVTLKGPVKTEAERESIEDKASEVVGAENVINRLSIRGQTQHN